MDLRRSAVMQWLRGIVMVLVFGCVLLAGCQGKKTETSELEVEINDTEHEIEWETTTEQEEEE